VAPERQTDGDPEPTPVAVRLLGGFEVAVGGRTVAADAWPARRAAELVQLLALAPDRWLLRDQVLEALWPHLAPEAGAANLRKAAHHVRRALGADDAIVLRGGRVRLFPGRRVEVDAWAFEAAAERALADGDPAACGAVADTRADLLPGALYADWTQGVRERLRARRLDLLRAAGRWEDVVELDPTDEPATRALMRAALDGGRPHAALRWYGRLRTTLQVELDVQPSDETRRLHAACLAGLVPAEPELVGRDVELGRAEAALAGPAPTIVVRGPAGIGKSALCRRVADLARERGWTVAATSGRGVVEPYAPLGELVGQLAGDGDGLLDGLGDTPRAALRAVSGTAAPPAGLTRHQVIGALRRLLRAAAAGGPGALVVLDDAHEADEATVDALAHLPVAGPRAVALVVAYRPERAAEPLQAAAARLARAGATTIDLPPLADHDAAALVAAAAEARPSAEAVAEVVRLAEGNPFFLRELATALGRDGGAPAQPSAWGAIARRFVDLDAGTVAMLSRLALAQDRLDAASVAALAGLTDDEAFALLDAALAAGVLLVEGEGYRFRHELVRRALIERLAPHQRVAVHRDAARRLAAGGAPTAVVAHHWLAGGRPAEAAGWLLEAARRAVALGGFADALHHLDALLGHEPGHAAARRLRAEALDALGDPSAPAAYAAAAAAAGRDEADDLLARRALAQLKAGDPDGALATAEGLRPASLDGRLALALTRAGAAALGVGDPEEGAALAADCRRLALRSGDPAAVVVASWAHAAAAHARGVLRDSVRLDLREAASLPTLATSVFDGQLCITQRFLYGARPYDEVIAFATSLEAEARRLGTVRGEAFAVTLRGEARLLAGRLDDAAPDLEAGAALHRGIGAATGEAHALQRRAELALHRGCADEAEPLLDEALAVARESDVGFHLFDRIHGTLLAAAPDPEAAARRLEEAEASIRGPAETCPGCRITFTVPAAIAAARAGDLGRARAHAAASERLAAAVMRLPAWDAAVDEVRGHVALAGGDRDGAARTFRAAAAGFAAAGHPLDAARCAALAGG
jgi:DNA-binding SARP family transcriptional activator/tetratricopeptide (TPR) repeat protein